MICWFLGTTMAQYVNNCNFNHLENSTTNAFFLVISQPRHGKKLWLLNHLIWHITLHYTYCVDTGKCNFNLNCLPGTASETELQCTELLYKPERGRCHYRFFNWMRKILHSSTPQWIFSVHSSRRKITRNITMLCGQGTILAEPYWQKKLIFTASIKT